MRKKKKETTPVQKPASNNYYVEKEIVDGFVDWTIWKHTPKEKKLLKRLRKTHKHALDGVKTPAPKKNIPVYDKLIIYVKTKSNDDKTTISTQCGQADIPDILSFYSEVLIKYSWNGKTYYPGEFPFWY